MWVSCLHEELGIGKVLTSKWENTPERLSNSEHPTRKVEGFCEFREVGLMSLDMATSVVKDKTSTCSAHK